MTSSTVPAVAQDHFQAGGRLAVTLVPSPAARHEDDDDDVDIDERRDVKVLHWLIIIISGRHKGEGRIHHLQPTRPSEGCGMSAASW